MLKLSFPVNVTEPKAVYEIPYGFIQRPADGEEEPGQQWLDVTGRYGEKEYGLALINSSKYSFSVKDNEMRMVVANGSIYNDHYGVRDEWCEYMDQGMQEFEYVLYPHAGSRQTAQVVKKAYEYNVKPAALMETYHEGDLPLVMEGIQVSSDNVIVTVFKRAEDGDGYILRCWRNIGRKNRNGYLCSNA
ncbi:MAG: glycoside hydrolase family 38 C-terminal domain-containing protein [Caldicoprobacterales bacterium]